MERKIFPELIKWKDREGRKPLLLLGVRQVGKTWLMKTLGQRCFDNVAYINCDAEPLTADLFSDYDIDRMLFSIQTITGVKPVAGKTLIILDELQQVKRGLHSLKYFCENAPQYHVVAAGSLLGITLGQGESFPVGKVDMLHVHPMDFEEFLQANAPQLLDVLQKGDWKMVGIFADKFVDQLRQYYFVGGMPEVVADFVNHHDQSRVRQLQQNILNAYRDDISKHTTTMESMRIGQVLDSLPSQLAKENKKFIYGVIRKGARAKDFELAIQWLVDAGIVCRVHRVKEIKMPIKFYEDLSAFKLFLCDCGLLGCMAGASPKQMLVGNNVFTEFKGAFTEANVMQQLVAAGLTPYYWSNDSTPAKIDFVVQDDRGVFPIEVKAEENVRAKSMAAYISSHPEAQLHGLRFSMKGYEQQSWMTNVPLYAISRLYPSSTVPWRCE
ncbi:MAG: ATP-binding protein [Prevotella sp.]|nr:ATP-binding protein [Prevotella sp.]